MKVSSWIKAIFLVIITTFLLPAITHANSEENYYEISLPISERSDHQRQQALHRGLSLILQSLSGDQDISTKPLVVEALKAPMSYVSQYVFQDEAIKIQFNQSEINELLQKVGVSTWGKKRPTVLMWLAVEDNDNRWLVGADTDPELNNLLNLEAKKLGLNFVVPLLDLEDISSVTVTDVWGNFPSVLKHASKRYKADVILVGRLRQQNLDDTGQHTWQGQWQLLGSLNQQNWNLAGNSIESNVKLVLQQLTKSLIGDYGIKHKSNPSTSTILVGISDIYSADDFANAMSYLQHLDLVNSAKVHQVYSNGAIFEITPHAEVDKNKFEQAVNLDNRLLSLIAKDKQLKETDLAFRWLP